MPAGTLRNKKGMVGSDVGGMVAGGMVTIGLLLAIKERRNSRRGSPRGPVS